MDTYTRHNRRSHTKSKTGCLTCRRRHVRCDELKPVCCTCLRLSVQCRYPEGVSSNPTEESCDDPIWAPGTREAIEAWIKGQQVPPLLRRVTSGSPAAFTGLSSTDARILHHGITFVEQLRSADAHVFTFGTICTSEFLSQVLEHPCVKTAFLAYASHHLCMVTQSTAADQLKRFYIGETYARLSIAVNTFSEETADAVLAASYLLGWATWEKEHYAKILSGTSHILGRMLQMQSLGFRSRLCTMFGDADRLPMDDRRVVVAYLSLPEDDLLQMKPLKQALEILIRNTDRQIATAARNLLDYIRNVTTKNFVGWSEQTGIFMSVHEWTPWVPTVSLGLAHRSIPIMTLTALYEAVIIASETYLPDVYGVLFPQKRTEVIGRIYNALCESQTTSDSSQTGQAEIDKAIATVTVAMVYAVRYITRSGKHVESTEPTP